MLVARRAQRHAPVAFLDIGAFVNAARKLSHDRRVAVIGGVCADNAVLSSRIARHTNRKLGGFGAATRENRRLDAIVMETDEAFDVLDHIAMQISTVHIERGGARVHPRKE